MLTPNNRKMSEVDGISAVLDEDKLKEVEQVIEEIEAKSEARPNSAGPFDANLTPVVVDNGGDIRNEPLFKEVKLGEPQAPKLPLILELKMSKLDIPAELLSEGVSVDVYALKKRQPHFFQTFIKHNTVNVGEDKWVGWEEEQLRLKKEKKERQKQREKDKEKVKAKVKLNLADVSSGSDSDLEELRAKLSSNKKKLEVIKPSFDHSSKKKDPPPTRKIVIHSSDEEIHDKDRERHKKKKKKKDHKHKHKEKDKKKERSRSKSPSSKSKKERSKSPSSKSKKERSRSKSPSSKSKKERSRSKSPSSTSKKERSRSKSPKPKKEERPKSPKPEIKERSKSPKPTTERSRSPSTTSVPKERSKSPPKDIGSTSKERSKSPVSERPKAKERSKSPGPTTTAKIDKDEKFDEPHKRERPKSTEPTSKEGEGAKSRSRSNSPKVKRQRTISTDSESDADKSEAVKAKTNNGIKSDNEEDGDDLQQVNVVLKKHKRQMVTLEQPALLYERKPPWVDHKYFDRHSDLRAFKDILIYELCPKPAFLEHSYKLSWAELERRTNEVLDNYALASCDKPSFVPAKRPIPEDTEEDKKLLEKFKIGKFPQVKLKDVKHRERHKKRYRLAADDYDDYAGKIKWGRRDKLVRGLRMIRSCIREDEFKRGLPDSFAKVKTKKQRLDSDYEDSSSDDDNAVNSAHNKKKSSVAINKYSYSHNADPDAKAYSGTDGSFKIPKKGEKVRAPILTEKYNLSYHSSGSISSSIMAADSTTETPAATKPAEPKKPTVFNVIDSIAGGMLSSKEPKDKEIVDARAREMHEKKRMQELMKKKVRNPQNRIFNAFTSWRDTNNLMCFKCWICNVKVEGTGRSALLSHADSKKHKANSKAYSDARAKPKSILNKERMLAENARKGLSDFGVKTELGVKQEKGVDPSQGQAIEAPIGISQNEEEPTFPSLDEPGAGLNLLGGLSLPTPVPTLPTPVPAFTSIPTQLEEDEHLNLSNDIIIPGQGGLGGGLDDIAADDDDDIAAPDEPRVDLQSNPIKIASFAAASTQRKPKPGDDSGTFVPRGGNNFELEDPGGFRPRDNVEDVGFMPRGVNRDNFMDDSDGFRPRRNVNAGDDPDGFRPRGVRDNVPDDPDGFRPRGKSDEMVDPDGFRPRNVPGQDPIPPAERRRHSNRMSPAGGNDDPPVDLFPDSPVRVTNNGENEEPIGSTGAAGALSDIASSSMRSDSQVPAPVPPPSAKTVAKKSGLSLADLDKLGSTMSIEDKVGHLNKSITKEDRERWTKEQEKIVRMGQASSSSSKNPDEEAPWGENDEAIIRMGKDKKKTPDEDTDFNIDPTGSFLPRDDKAIGEEDSVGTKQRNQRPKKDFNAFLDDVIDDIQKPAVTEREDELEKAKAKLNQMKKRAEERPPPALPKPGQEADPAQFQSALAKIRKGRKHPREQDEEEQFGSQAKRFKDERMTELETETLRKSNESWLDLVASGAWKRVLNESDHLPEGGIRAYPDLYPVIQRLLDSFLDGALIGLEYILELRQGKSEPIYRCLLCNKETQVFDLVVDIMSAEHRLKYLRQHFPLAYKRFAKVPNLRVWQGSTFAFLDSVADKIEKKFGRLRPLVATARPWNESTPKVKAQVMKLIDDGPHFRESPELNFTSLLDPFGTYIKSLPPEEINDEMEDGEILD